MLDHDHFQKRGVCKEAYASERARKVLEKKGLWDHRYTLDEVEVSCDPFDLGIDKLRAVAETGGATGSLSVTAMAGCRVVASFSWRYQIRGDDETWLLSAERRPHDGSVHCAEAAYGLNGGLFDNISEDSLMVRLFAWMIRDVGTAQGLMPDWAGSFSAGASQYALITIDDCVSCDTPFCNCE